MTGAIQAWELSPYKRDYHAHATSINPPFVKITLPIIYKSTLGIACIVQNRKRERIETKIRREKEKPYLHIEFKINK
jgi:hypothetical protein